jgi:hypothetical protein
LLEGQLRGNRRGSLFDGGRLIGGFDSHSNAQPNGQLIGEREHQEHRDGPLAGTPAEPELHRNPP